MLVPQEAPIAPDVSFEQLGERYELSGGYIKSAVFRAAVEASLQVEEAKRRITMDALVAAAKEEVEKSGDSAAAASMYS